MALHHCLRKGYDVLDQVSQKAQVSRFGLASQLEELSSLSTGDEEVVLVGSVARNQWRDCEHLVQERHPLLVSFNAAQVLECRGWNASGGIGLLQHRAPVCSHLLAAAACSSLADSCREEGRRRGQRGEEREGGGKAEVRGEGARLKKKHLGRHR